MFISIFCFEEIGEWDKNKAEKNVCKKVRVKRGKEIVLNW